MAEPTLRIETTKEGANLHVILERKLTHSFLNGVMVGVGSAVGATFVFGLLIFILGQLDTVPLVGQYITDVLNYIQNTTTQ